MDEWTIVPWSQGAEGPTCSAECPVGYEEILDDEGNWCFEPEPVPIDAQTETQTPGAPAQPAPKTNGAAGKTAASVVATATPKAPVPMWVFGLVAVVGVFALAAWMSPD
jgi:hypothetical protein